MDDEPKPSTPAPPQTATESISAASAHDQPTDRDTLGFQPYVRAVAQFLSSPATKPPVTISVEGEWGSGKTSFMRQLEARLEWGEKASAPPGERRRKDRKELTVRFDAWRHDKDEALWAAFAVEFVRSITKKLTLQRRLCGHLRLLWWRFSWRDGWLEAVRAAFLSLAALVVAFGGGWMAVTEGPDAVKNFTAMPQLKNHGWMEWAIPVGGGAGYLALVYWLAIWFKRSFGNPLDIDLQRYVRSPDYQGRISFVERFHADFAKIVKAYAGVRRVFVFVDDLDRCEVPKAAELMQALNLLIAQDPRLIFIIGMDREKVAAGLAVKYKDFIPYLQEPRTNSADPHGVLFGLEYGYAFIEKFIQLPFGLPRPQSDDLEQMLRSLSSGAAEPVSPPQPWRLWPQKLAQKLPLWLSGRWAGKSRDSGSLGLGPGETSSVDEQKRSGSAAKTTEKEGRRQRLEIQVANASGKESGRLHQIVLTLAPSLDNNPRRIKQFINLFRLRTFIAAETGLFDEPAGEDAGKRAALTLE